MTEDLDREAGRGHVQTQGGVFPRDAFTTLDYGIRWFGDDGSSGDDNFDPGKPTVIYIHGWQAFSTRSLRRELLTGPSPDASDGEQDWKTAWQGWNVGIFYWNQLADELEVKNAEAKIWAADNGRRGMRFRYVLPGQQGPAPYDVAYEDSPDATPNVPVGALLFESYVANMERYEDGLLTPPEVRIVGHSLGNQLAVDLAYRVLAAIEDGELDPNLLPTRVALLDPFYTNGGKDYLGGEQTGERVRRYARALRESGVLLESYRSSVVANNPFVGDTNRELMGMVAFQNVQPKFLDTTQLVAKHKYAKQFYFDTYNGLEWSLEPDPRTSKLPAEASLSANSDSETVRDAMRSCLKFVQSKGQYTMDYTDDAFSTKEKAMPTDDCI